MLSERMSPQDTLIYMMRTDRITVDRVKTAAKLGDPTAKALFPSEGLVEWHEWQKQLELLKLLTNPELLRFALACAEHVLPVLFSNEAIKRLGSIIRSLDVSAEASPSLCGEITRMADDHKDDAVVRYLAYALADYVGLKASLRNTSGAITFFVSSAITAAAQAVSPRSNLRSAEAREEQAWQKSAFIKALLTF